MTVASRVGYDMERLDVWGDEQSFEVTADRTIAYAKATNDPISQHVQGVLAPPVFAVVPAMNLMAEATMSVVPDALMLRILHGEHDFRFHRPIKPGETLSVRAKPIGIEGKSSGVVVTTLMETRSATHGDLVNEQYFIGFFRGGEFDGSVGETSPNHSFDISLRERDADYEFVQQFDADQTFRYAEPAGDPMPIHLDDAFAKQMGLKGIIIHGLCTIAFVSHAIIGAVSPKDPSTLKRLAVRLSKPAIPCETITTSAWRSIAGGNQIVSFETAGDEEPGKFVITDGLAEFAV
ncbi:acyl dehydratase [Mycobacteroides chelonae]|nr:acyl dehydratase [Mycobacteroides chelonae]